MRLLFCFLIFLGIIKGIFSYIWFHYFFHHPLQIDNWDLIIERYPILNIITPYEPVVYCEIIRKRSSEMFKKLKKLKKLSDKNVKWQESQEWRESLDIFNGNKIKYIIKNNELLFYSIGPDKIDDKALILYDPSNGIVSRGDITNIMGWKVKK